MSLWITFKCRDLHICLRIIKSVKLLITMSNHDSHLGSILKQAYILAWVILVFVTFNNSKFVCLSMMLKFQVFFFSSTRYDNFILCVIWLWDPFISLWSSDSITWCLHMYLAFCDYFRFILYSWFPIFISWSNISLLHNLKSSPSYYQYFNFDNCWAIILISREPCELVS